MKEAFRGLLQNVPPYTTDSDMTSRIIHITLPDENNTVINKLQSMLFYGRIDNIYLLALGIA